MEKKGSSIVQAIWGIMIALKHIYTETDTLLPDNNTSGRQKKILSYCQRICPPIAKALTRIQNNQHILNNSGSTAAWTRTSLSLIGASIGLLKWQPLKLQTEGYLIGILGCTAFVTSTWRYFHVQHLLLEGKFEPNVISILFVMSCVAVVIAWALTSSP